MTSEAVDPDAVRAASAGQSSRGLLIEAIAALGVALKASVQQLVVGNSEAIDVTLVALLARGHILVEDVPGTGKTTLCKALAEAAGAQFSRIQFTPDLMPTDVLGVNIFDPAKRRFEFHPGPVFANVVLADEINRASPRTQSALLESMQERQVSIDGVTSPLPELFTVLATLNPVEMEGTFPLPEAQLDRFLVRISLGYPSLNEEDQMLQRFASGIVPAVQAAADVATLVAARAAVGGVTVSAPVRAYLLGIVAATRSHKQVQLGASPRAALGLLHAAQARAALNGRDFVLPDDIKFLAAPVLAHRLLGGIDGMLRGVDSAHIVHEIVTATPVPIGA